MTGKSDRGAEVPNTSAEEAAVTGKPAPLPKFKESEDGVWAIHIQSHGQLQSMFGSESHEFANALAQHCGNVSGSREANRDDKNHALAIVAEIAPKDGIEAMLATQMAAVHIAMMRHSRHMAGVDTIPQLDLQERILNKLGRTFTAQMEALRKHRHGGQQKMTVEHVTVNDGGQAIVGNVSKGGAQE